MQDTMTLYCSFPCALAMAYVRFQVLGSTYAPQQALMRGTLFPEMDKPFLAERRRIAGE